MCNFSCPLLVSVALTLGCQGTQRLKGLEVSLHIEGFPSVGGTWKKKKEKKKRWRQYKEMEKEGSEPEKVQTNEEKSGKRA